VEISLWVLNAFVLGLSLYFAYLVCRHCPKCSWNSLVIEHGPVISYIDKEKNLSVYTQIELVRCSHCRHVLKESVKEWSVDMNKKL
jgi:hypothetical protein